MMLVWRRLRNMIEDGVDCIQYVYGDKRSLLLLNRFHWTYDLSLFDIKHWLTRVLQVGVNMGTFTVFWGHFSRPNLGTSETFYTVYRCRNHVMERPE